MSRFSLFNIDVMIFVLSYYTLFCLVFLLSHRSLLFPKEGRKGMHPQRRGGGKEPQGVEGGETEIRIHCIRKETISNNSTNKKCLSLGTFFPERTERQEETS